MASSNAGHPVHDTLLTDESVQLVSHWLRTAEVDRDESLPASTLRRLVEDEAGLSFAMRFVDQVSRPDDDKVAARQLGSLVRGQALPSFLSGADRVALRAGGALAPRLPSLVMPLARRRMREMVGHLVIGADGQTLAAHLATGRAAGYAHNINLLGEAVLGQRGAARRLEATVALIDQPDVEYVSVKLSSITARLNPWDWDGSLERATDELRKLLRRANATTPPTFVNLDVEEYHDLELTKAAFRTLLSEPEFITTEAGIVLQAYLPDSFVALRELVSWATARHEQGGGTIKVMLVKGANLAMERVEAALRGWQPAPYDSKAEVDANFKRCIDWVLRPNRVRSVRVGVASHNLFDVAWAHLVANSRGVGDRIEIDMLQGVAPAHARVVQDAAANPVRLYTPIVSDRDFDVAIGYLFRRLDDSASPGNYLRSLFELSPGSPAFVAEASRFRRSVADRWSIDGRPRRRQDRPARGAIAAEATAGQESPADEPGFVNEPDTDPSLATNRAWMAQVVETRPGAPTTALTTSVNAVGAAVARSRAAAAGWAATPPSERRRVCHRIADQLARRRGPLISALLHEAGKTVAEADPEVSEAIDFARYYGDLSLDLVDNAPGVGYARFEPLGVVAVVPPWNFPVSLAAGGVVAALAAGNTVILKPSPRTPRTAELVFAACDAAGLPTDVLQLLRTPDDDAGRTLITSVDGVIFTGSIETACRFQSWKPDLALFAETSGKNALVITPHADVDLAVADLVRSAFGHAGQKSSAASLAVCVGGVERSDRFVRQLCDAVESLAVGPADQLASVIGPLIEAPEPTLERALTQLDPGETWMVQPAQLDRTGRLWRPGVRAGVKPGSWFHRTECFGPVLGLIRASTLDQAIDIQNSGDTGLVGGIHSLDEAEIEHWLGRVEVGNASINRPTTGAIVGRQPFGGWKRSNVGPGAKVGGPNYLYQLGRWRSGRPVTLIDEDFLTEAEANDRRWWAQELSIQREVTHLGVESNIFRYQPLRSVAVRAGDGFDFSELERVLAAAELVGVPVELSRASEESEHELFERLDRLPETPTRIRALGQVSDELRREAAARSIHLADDPVTDGGRLELRHFVREQTISRSMHRFGTMVGGAPPPR